jgi:hypothetical protein
MQPAIDSAEPVMLQPLIAADAGTSSQGLAGENTVEVAAEAAAPAALSSDAGSASPSDNPQLTWEAAPSCTATPSPANSVKDSNGRLWGWESNASCAYKTASTPVYTHGTAPGCGPTAAKAGFRTQDSMGYTWGYEDGHSCLFRVRIGG